MSTALILVPAVLVLGHVFKPLLKGIARASMMLVTTPLTAEEKEARRHMEDHRLLQNMINSSSGPSLASELQAIGARG